MIVTLNEFEAKLREYIGTPFRHAGRIAGPTGGLDCGGLISLAMSDLGMSIDDPSGYRPGDGLDMLVDVLERHCDKKPGIDIIEPGDLVLIRGPQMYHHLIYWTQVGTIIHAWQTTGVNKVVETTMLPLWWQLINSVWHIRELETWQQLS